MSPMWIVVANSSMARILSTSGAREPLVELECLAHPGSRLPDRDLASDRLGSAQGIRRGTHGVMSPEVAPRDEEAIRFAEQIAGKLRHAHAAHEFDKLAIVASPRFLGLLRERMTPALRHAIAGTLDKDFATLPPEEIRARLPERLYSTLQ
jgi:protein required for attachment to host cells